MIRGSSAIAHSSLSPVAGASRSRNDGTPLRDLFGRLTGREPSVVPGAEQIAVTRETIAVGTKRGPHVDADRVAGEPTVSLDVVRRQRVGVRTALDDLERALAAPSAGRTKDWTSTVRERTAALAAAFANHVAVTEQPAGLFDDILDREPRLAGRITRLRHEHVEIAARLSDVERAAQHEDPEQEVEAVRDATLAVMGAVVRHRSAGSSLLYEAYFVDIDASD
jgi:hypothetical protein